MTEATRQRAFERYFRGELAASAPGSGLGLSLSLVKLTAELLGGAAALANAPEGSLAASITLPASEASD
ncbi:MAG: hypothetical protein MO853_10030 [Candidatus Protistobacter heckmanni]|nr:hypothetical protein [Candidatus Protistobacter heckmanni]